MTDHSNPHGAHPVVYNATLVSDDFTEDELAHLLKLTMPLHVCEGTMVKLPQINSAMFLYVYRDDAHQHQTGNIAMGMN